jgi:two-component system, LytTR family, sensor kinase
MTGMIPQTAITAAPTPPPRADRRVALWSIFAFWAFYFVLNTALMAIEGAHDQLSMLPRRGGVAVAGIALTFVMYLILRRVEGRSMRFLVTTAFLISIPASIAYATVNYAAFYLIAPTNSMLQETAQAHTKHESLAAIITESAVSWYFFIAAWGVLYVALSYAAKMAHAERSAAAYKAEAQAAQLRALRYQINPHFLFNTLNSVSSLIRSNPEQARSVVYRLSSILRRLLRKTDNLTPLREELAFIDNYMTIEMVRFGEKLRFVKEIDPETLDRMVPSMLLQPLIENSIRHGLATKVDGGMIRVRSYLAEGRLNLVVEDDGVGIPETRLATLFEQGIGVSNVNERMKVLYGPDYRMWIDSKPGEGTRTGIEIPDIQLGSDIVQEIPAAG